MLFLHFHRRMALGKPDATKLSVSRTRHRILCKSNVVNMLIHIHLAELWIQPSKKGDTEIAKRRHEDLKMPYFQRVWRLVNTVQVLFPSLWETGLYSLQTSFTKSPSFCHQSKALSWYNGSHHFQGEAPVWFHISAYGISLNGVGTPGRISPGLLKSATAPIENCWTVTLFAWMFLRESVRR